MNGKQKVRVIVTGICLMLLIVDGKCALEGAKYGIALCAETVFPALFPFFVLSMLLTRDLGNHGGLAGRMLADVLRIPYAAVPVLVPAFLGGYPVGAKSVADMYHNERISQAEAERLLAFCNNAGPSFLFGMISGFFPDRRTASVLWLIHIMGAVFTSSLFPAEPRQPGDNIQKTAVTKQGDIMLPALKAAGVVCGWVVLFRILVAFLDRWVLWILPQWLRVLIIGILELSNGCCELLRIPDVRLRFVLCSCMLSAGGCCVYLQTDSVTGDLSLRKYLTGKGIQTGFSCLVSYLFVSEYTLLKVIAVPVLTLFFIGSKNRCRNPEAYPV